MTSRSEASASLRSSSVRPGFLELIQIGFRDVLSRRRLIAYLVRADLKKRGADTLLGNVWWVVDPLLQMVIYFVFMGIILQRSTPDFPLFLFSGILPWKWFDSTLKDGLLPLPSPSPVESNDDCRQTQRGLGHCRLLRRATDADHDACRSGHAPCARSG